MNQTIPRVHLEKLASLYKEHKDTVLKRLVEVPMLGTSTTAKKMYVDRIISVLASHTENPSETELELRQALQKYLEQIQ